MSDPNPHEHSPHEHSPHEHKPRKHSRTRATIHVTATALALFFVVAYIVLPLLWLEAERNVQPMTEGIPKVTHNADKIPGDPLNVGLVGTRDQIIQAMLAIGWRPADPITFESSLGIAESVLFDRPDPEAPVSNLFVFGRKQDLAFEKEVGKSASQRHHVRYWQTKDRGPNQEPLWIGSATFDIGSGLSHRTGQITHHIDADVDAQRNQVIDELHNAGLLESEYPREGVGATKDGHNAGGDRYFTDGKVRVGVLTDNKITTQPSSSVSTEGSNVGKEK